MRYLSPLYKSLPEEKVECRVCARKCIIEKGEKGYCKTRVNEDGKLYSLIYGEVSSLHLSPIEIKPMYHFYPGTYFLSLGSLGCNFLCPGCQNWSIAHRDAEEGIKSGETRYYSPQEIVRIALREKAKGISFTYNEPILWIEYARDVFGLAKRKGLVTNYVTNGYITETALDFIGPYLDSFRVDIKGFQKTTYRRIAHLEDFEEILKATKRAKFTWGMHVEVVTNVIPGFNDNLEEMRKLARWIRKELGEETPWHITRFFPHHKLFHLSPTPISTLLKIHRIGKEEGLHFVYLGNIPFHSYENTYCPSCNSLLIERNSFTVKHIYLKGKECPRCGEKILLYL